MKAVWPALMLMLALGGCAHQVQHRWRVPVIAASDGVLSFDGEVYPDSFDKLMATVGTQPIHTLRIRSGGGSVEQAVLIATWVYDHKIDVEVDGPCYSSCANYIFPAGRTKTITGKGIVAWHGTAEHRLYLHHTGVKVVGAEELKRWERSASAERAFYAHTGVNGYMSWFAKIAPYKVKSIYFMSQDDMAYFGLAGLKVRPDYTLAAPKDFTLVRVNRSVTNPSDPLWRH